jgi:hypothetical protein
VPQAITNLCWVVSQSTIDKWEQKVEAALKSQGIDMIDFQDSLAINLRKGNLLLLIVGDRISPNMALLTKAISSAPGLEFQFGLVEMRLYPLVPGNEWPLVVVPDVVGRTVEKLRGVVRVRYTQEKPELSVDIEDDPDHESPLVPSQWDEASLFPRLRDNHGEPWCNRPSYKSAECSPHARG